MGFSVRVMVRRYGALGLEWGLGCSWGWKVRCAGVSIEIRLGRVRDREISVHVPNAMRTC